MHVLTAVVIIFSMISGGRLSNPIFITSFVVALLLQLIWTKLYYVLFLESSFQQRLINKHGTMSFLNTST